MAGSISDATSRRRRERHLPVWKDLLTSMPLAFALICCEADGCASMDIHPWQARGDIAEMQIERQVFSKPALTAEGRRMVELSIDSQDKILNELLQNKYLVSAARKLNHLEDGFDPNSISQEIVEAREAVNNPVYEALRSHHRNFTVFSYEMIALFRQVAGRGK